MDQLKNYMQNFNIKIICYRTKYYKKMLTRSDCHYWNLEQQNYHNKVQDFIYGQLNQRKERQMTY
jgi:hypothetical protein